MFYSSCHNDPYENFGADDLCHIAEVSDFRSSHQGYLSDTRALLELYKASEVSVADNEFILDRIGSWSGRLLKEQLSSGALQRTSSIFEEVVSRT